MRLLSVVIGWLLSASGSESRDWWREPTDKTVSLIYYLFMRVYTSYHFMQIAFIEA